RKAGTGIYVVIPEGDAARYKIVLSILFGLAASITRKTSNDERGAPVLLALDEAGNIPLHNLAEALGVGRGRRCGIVLGYQNIGQLYKQHGRDGAQAILGSIGTMVFLPGLDAETAQYAARRIGRTTVLQHRSVDATGTMFDHEGQTETGRDLLDAAELRQMAEYTQAVAILGPPPPVRFRFPECARNGRQAHALPRELARPVTFAEAAFSMQQTEKAAGPPSGAGPGGDDSSSGPHEGAMRQDPSKDVKLSQPGRGQDAGGDRVAEEMIRPVEEIPFDSVTDSSGEGESIDSLVNSLLPLPPDPADRDDDLNSTLGNLSLYSFARTSATKQPASAGKEAGG